MDASMPLESPLGEQTLLEEYIRHAAVAIAITTIDGRFLGVTPALCAMLGYDESDLMRHTTDVFSDSEDRTSHGAWMAQILEGIPPGGQREGRLITRGGEPRWVRFDASVIRLPGGSEPRIIIQVHDITEYKRVAEDLREKEEFQRLILEMAHEAFVSIDASGVITSWNRQAEQTLGWSATEAVGRELISTIIPPRFRNAHAKGLERFLATGEGPVLNRRLELPAIHRDGHEISVEITIFTVIWKGQSTFHAFLHDITSKKESEARISRQVSFVQLLQKVAVSSNEATSVDDAFQACLIEVARTAGCQVGHVALPAADRPGHMVPTEIWYLEGPERFEAFRRITERTVLGPGEGLPGRVLANRKPAWIVDVMQDPNFPRARAAEELGIRGAFAFPVLVGAEVAAVLEFFSVESREPDEPLLEVLAHVGTQLGRVIERARAEQQAQRRALELEHSNTRLEQFAYVTSHDLQEPLRMVTSYVQLLQRRYQGKLGSDADEYISYAVDGAARMQALIQDLLAYSRLDSDEQKFVRVSCEEALATAVQNLQMVIDESGATVTHDRLPQVQADAGQMVQLFQNLVGNALKFRSERPTEIHVGAARRGREWVLGVRDNGIGIEPRFQQRIFQVFQRLHSRQEYSGTGIGLAICKRIVENHGGRIWVESQTGSGATFFFTLPDQASPA
jgi:PAS domain S-box-containing protein